MTNLYKIIEGRDHTIKDQIIVKGLRLSTLSNSHRSVHYAKRCNLQLCNYFNYMSFIMILPMIDRSVRLCENLLIGCVWCVCGVCAYMCE